MTRNGVEYGLYYAHKSSFIILIVNYIIGQLNNSTQDLNSHSDNE